MSKCSICKYSTNNQGLCERPERIFGGIECDYFSIRKPQVCVDNICIVHCKDCKHWKSGKNKVGCYTNLGENIGECHCSQWENDYFYYLTKDTDFCSYGERKDVEEKTSTESY